MEYKTLKEFIKTVPIGERKSFGERCQTSWKHIVNVAYGNKKAGENLCINIERESKGVVRCESLRPDVDWNFLRGTKKAA